MRIQWIALFAAGLAACDDDGDEATTDGGSTQDAAIGADTGTDAGGDAGGDMGAGDPPCEVVIVGGGAGGIHTAYRLAPTLGAGVCLFEKEAQLGGRLKDVALDENDPMSPRVGVGGRRVMEGQSVLFALAEELNLTLETPDAAGDFLQARGEFHFSKEEFVPLYPGLTADPGGDTETALYDALRMGPERANTGNYADFPAYVRAVAGEDGYQFLRDMSRFRADFEYALDAEGYLDYLDEEWDVCCTPSYPVGGMTTFILGMEAAATAAGARIFKGEAVTSIAKGDDSYFVTTTNRSVDAAKVVIAVPPIALNNIGGDVADRIKAQPEYQAITAVKVVTITQWWENDWWTQVRNPADPDTLLWRAWTTEHCLNFVEIPIEPYAAAAKVTRSVYNDNLECSIFWEELAAQGTEAVEAELQTALTALYNNGLTEPAMVEVPMPLKTHVQVWPDAWHWLKAGTGFTNASVFEWSIAPLGEEPVALVGEAYHVNRSGWSDGAYKSSIRVLNEKYGMTLPDGSMMNKTARSVRQGRHQGGH